MFGCGKIRIDKGLFVKAEQQALQLGYASLDEFVSHLLERELDRRLARQDDERDQLSRRLKGLGYLE